MSHAQVKSIHVQRALAPKVTEAKLNYELHRFCTMDEDALIKRIAKIKDPVKLEACRQIAKDVGLKKIMRLARKRRNELYWN